MQRASWVVVMVVTVGIAARSHADCTVTGDYTISCGGTTYRAVDDECVHYIDLAAHNAAHPGVPLPALKKRIVDNYAADAVPEPVVVELTDYVNCTQTDHNFSHASLTNYRPNQPSRLMNISGKTFRVTAWPQDGFDTMYYTYDVTLSGTAGTPHLLVAESSNDQERYTSLLVHHPDQTLTGVSHPPPAWASYQWAPPYAGEPTIEPWGSPWWSVNASYTQQAPVFAPDVGLTTYTGRELPVDSQPFNISLIFHAKSTVARIVVSSLGCNVTRTSTDGGAVSQMWVFKFVDALGDHVPAHTLPAWPDQQRRIGIYLTHPWYLYAHNGTPVRLLAQRQAGLQRMVEHLAYCGINYLVFNAINGADRSEKAWYSGSSYFDWNAAGDLLAELPPIAAAEGLDLVPLITSLQATPSNGLSFSNNAYQMGSDGNWVLAFSNKTLDPLHPEVQQLTFNLLDEIANRCASSPAVRGIGIRANGKIGTCYTAQQDSTRGARLSGYSSWDLQQFKNDTSSGVPTSPPLTAYNWLVANPSEWEAWINWRCVRTRAFWLACRDRIKSHRSDLIFYVQCDLPSEMPGTNIEWPAETPYNLLRHHGYDPNMFVNDSGIIITRGMMVALDRFKVSSRWSAPWGSNYQNYRLFHYASGLAELYRTAQGRACDFYQDYWEEAYNPYYEFGYPENPPSAPVYFRTTTPAAPGRYFFAGAAMSVRRQNPDTITWLGWNRPTLGHESRLRKFAQAFRALPAVDPTPFAGTIDPAMTEVVARWHADRLAVINDTSSARTITLHFAQPVPNGDELTDVVTGRKLISAAQIERQHVSFAAEAYSLNTFLFTEAPGPWADFTTDPLPTEHPLTVQFHDASIATHITSWDWDFGDNTPHGSGPDPQHTYADYDTYQVTLTITADEGTLATSKPITLTPAPPTVASESPPRGATVSTLPSVSVTFSKPVTGVAAGDLTVNSSPATSVVGEGAGPYLFAGYAAPGAGTVEVVLGPGSIQDLYGVAFAGDSWQYTVPPPPVPGVDNPSFEDSGGSLNGWQIVIVQGDGPDNPPLDNTNQWGVTTSFGTHFGGKITNGLRQDFYLGQVVGVTNWHSASTRAEYQLATWVQLRCTHENNPNPTGVHQVWEIGWNDDGSEPAGIMDCDHYEVMTSASGTYTGNDVNFHQLQASGAITGATGLRAVALRVRMYNDGAWWWTFVNTDNVGLVVTSEPPPVYIGDLDRDQDVDVDDARLFQACMTGPDLGPPVNGCHEADLDDDQDIDQSDFGLLQCCLSGPGLQPGPECEN